MKPNLDGKLKKLKVCLVARVLNFKKQGFYNDIFINFKWNTIRSIAVLATHNDRTCFF